MWNNAFAHWLDLTVSHGLYSPQISVLFDLTISHGLYNPQTSVLFDLTVSHYLYSPQTHILFDLTVPSVWERDMAPVKFLGTIKCIAMRPCKLHMYIHLRTREGGENSNDRGKNLQCGK